MYSTETYCRPIVWLPWYIFTADVALIVNTGEPSVYHVYEKLLKCGFQIIKHPKGKVNVVLLLVQDVED